jgi:glycosyltransferase involved in cell wall biosynthesis
MNPETPWVPHMVDLPEPSKDMRPELGISPDQFVFGRIGAKETFNLGFVYHNIYRLLEMRDDVVFLFVGTNRWIDHPRVIFYPEVQDPQMKSNLINTWDAMIHGRSEGESFGVAIVEALSLGKPVLSWEGGHDMNHTLVLKDSGLLYSHENLFDKLSNIRYYMDKECWADRVSQFRPSPVMQKFNDVFLKE